MAKSLVEQPQPLSLNSTLGQLLNETIESKSPKGVLRIAAGKHRNVVFVCFISDENGYMQAIQAYEYGRDDFTMRAVNAVLDHVRANGVPEKNSDLNLHLHS